MKESENSNGYYSSRQDSRVRKISLQNTDARMPPQATDIEKAVLGALMLEREAIGEVEEFLRAKHFYEPAYATVYQAILNLSAKGNPIDIFTVCEELKRMGELEKIGGVATVAALTAEVNSSANVQYHAQIILEKAIKRELHSISHKIGQDSLDDLVDVFDLLDTAQQRLFDLAEATIRRKAADMQSVFTKTIKEIAEKRKNKNGLTGVASGFTNLDRLTSGWQPSDLVIIAARPAMGKAQPLDAPLLTAKGWKKMGDLHIEDRIAGSDGNFYPLRGIFPQGKKDVYEVFFDDGTSATCCLEHLWFSATQAELEAQISDTNSDTDKAGIGKVRSLAEIWDTLYLPDGTPNHHIPLTQPIQFEPKMQDFPPYGVGFLLSNRNLRHIVEKDLVPLEPLRSQLKTLFHEFENQPISIPESYLWGSLEQRLELLEGILEQGYPQSPFAQDKSRGVYPIFEPQNNQPFIKDLLFLIRSLGGWAKYEEGAVHFELPEALFDLRVGKALGKSPVPLFKHITAIAYKETVETQCIQVASPDHLYLTSDFTLTHNTAFVLSAARNAAMPPFCRSVAIFSLEMSSEQLLLRLISGEAEIESEKLRSARLQEYEWEQLLKKTSTLAQAKLFIDDTPAISILELRAKCRRLKAQHGIDLIIIDYLQLMTGESSRQGNREQEIASVSRALKQLAKELNVPVLALSQLSRAVETRGGDKKPQLSDLRESGSIEQDADMVLFLYRPEYYEITEFENGESTKNIAEVIVAKNRHGSVDTIRLRFEKPFVKFKDLEDTGSGYVQDDFGRIDDGFSDIMDVLPSKANNPNATSFPKSDFEEEPPF
jgi:replicative DNA helicase